MDTKVNLIERATAIDAALKSYQKHKLHTKITNHKYLVVIDFSQPSYKERLYVIEIKTGNLLRDHHVAHGISSNCTSSRARACHFSNKIGSRQSSLGAMVTGNTYRWGTKYPTPNKLKLHGLEKGINNNVFTRAIVIHSSNYVTNNYIFKYGRAGNSWGCPAIDPAIAEELIEIIRHGTFVYAYAPNK